MKKTDVVSGQVEPIVMCDVYQKQDKVGVIFKNITKIIDDVKKDDPEFYKELINLTKT